MTGAEPRVHLVVVAEDAVQAGMLALDLVQAGYEAHAASDEHAAFEQVCALVERGDTSASLVLDFDAVERASALCRRLISAGIHCRVVVAAEDSERRRAEEEANLLDWLGVIPRPVDVAMVTGLLGQRDGGHPVAVVREADSGSLRDDELGDLISRLLDDVSRPPEQINAVVQLKSKGRGGKVAILQGQLVHAQTDEDQGRHALERMFCWRKGMWRVVRGIHSGPRTLRGSARAHIAAAREYARRVEQARNALPHSEAICAVRWERVRPLPVVAEALFRRVAGGVPMGDALDGDGDDELEAFAALLSRIKRGAVAPREQAPRRVSGQRPASRAMRTTGEQVWQESQVEAPQLPQTQPRHASTSAYTGVGDLRSGGLRPPPAAAPAPAPIPERRHPSSGDGILPLDLPAYDDGTDVRHRDPAPHHAEAGRAAPGRVNTGWFGGNVAHDPVAHDESLPTADVSAVQRAVLEAVPARSAELSGAGSVRVRELPRPKRAAPAALESHYALWSNDYAGLESRVEQEVSQAEILLAPPRRGRGSTTLWVLALALVACVLVLVVMPPDWLLTTEPAHPVVADESPVIRTYRQAVEFIDQDRHAEAQVLLRNVTGKPGVAPEALLQLAVLEIEGGMTGLGRHHLEAYLDDPAAVDKERARRLHAHLFGPRRRGSQAP